MRFRSPIRHQSGCLQTKDYGFRTKAAVPVVSNHTPDWQLGVQLPKLVPPTKGLKN
jgi:hypothetical protein